MLTQTTWQDKTAGTGKVTTAWEYYPNRLLKQKWYDATIAEDGTISGTENKVSHSGMTPEILEIKSRI